jgi:hypothetical protein
MHDLSARNKALQMQAPPKHGRIAIRIVMFSCGRVRVHVTRGDITSNCGSSLLSSARTIVLRVTAQFADEAATLTASWALVLVVLVRDASALAVHEQRRIANARKPTEDGEQLLLLRRPPMVFAAAAVSLCGARNCICGRRVVELVLTAGPARAFRCPPAADLTVCNGAGVATEAILRPLDRRSSLRTRAATCRPLACVALATEPLVVRLTRLLVRVVHLPTCTEPAA